MTLISLPAKQIPLLLPCLVARLGPFSHVSKAAARRLRPSWYLKRRGEMISIV